MKICFISRAYPPDSSWGSGATGAYNLTRELAKLGVEVHVICQAIGTPKDYLDSGVFVHRVGSKPKKGSMLASFDFKVNTWRKVKQLVGQYGIDVIDAPYWTADGLFFCFRKQIPLLIRGAHPMSDGIRSGEYVGLAKLVKGRMLSYIEDLIARKADMVTTESKESYDLYVKDSKIDPDKAVAVPLGIDIERFKRRESKTREKLGVSIDARIVLSVVGRLEFRKGIQVLFEAVPKIVNRIPYAVFVIVGRDDITAPGGGSFRQYLCRASLGAAVEGSIIWVDYLSDVELVELYSACEVYVSPSLRETFGYTVIEALSCGRPVVATSRGITSELHLRFPYGIFVPPGDAKSLQDAVIRMLISGSGSKGEVSLQNRKLAEVNFSAYSYAKRVLEVYRKVVEPRQEYVPTACGEPHHTMR